MVYSVGRPRLSIIERIKLWLFRYFPTMEPNEETLYKLVQLRGTINNILNKYSYNARKHLATLIEEKILEEIKNKIEELEEEKDKLERQLEDAKKKGDVGRVRVLEAELARVIEEINYYSSLYEIISVITNILKKPIIRSEYLKIAYEATDTTSIMLSQGLEAMRTDAAQKARDLINKYKQLEEQAKKEARLREEFDKQHEKEETGVTNV